MRDFHPAAARAALKLLSPRLILFLLTLPFRKGMNRFDYVIVGAGTAGCVLAARLSEDPQVRVCLVEAGGPARSPLRQGSGTGRLRDHGSRASTWGLMTEPQAALDNRRIFLPRGKVVGGSGSINGMAYHRGHPRDYDDWAARGQCRMELERSAAVFPALREQRRLARSRHPRSGWTRSREAHTQTQSPEPGLCTGFRVAWRLSGTARISRVPNGKATACARAPSIGAAAIPPRRPTCIRR